MEHGFYADTLRLLQHSGQIREEKRTAALLYEQLRLMCRNADPAYEPACRKLMGQAGQLERYFGAMADTVEQISEDLEQLSLKIGDMLSQSGHFV